MTSVSLCKSTQIGYNRSRMPSRRQTPDTMLKRIQETDHRLESLFGCPRRSRRDPIETLVACILSQATTDAQSDAAYEALVAKFPTWEAMCAAQSTAIARAIRSAGLSKQKAHTIQNALRFIRDERGAIELDFLKTWQVETARRWLMQIRGIGLKTASIVLLFALGKDAFPVDTHIHRVTARLGWIPAKTTAEQAARLLEPLIPPKRYYPLHINLIRLGREICLARRPRCERCPLTDLCAYFQTLRLPHSRETRQPANSIR